MTTLDYHMLGEVARTVSGEMVRRPSPVRDRWGCWHRDPAGEYDWYYQLSELERAYVSRHYMSAHGVQPDVLATMGGYAYVDDWADAFVANVRAARSRLDPLDDQYGEDDDDDMELGPAELCELLAIKRNTIAQWRHRGRLPVPYRELSGMPIWRKGDVMAFAVLTGREVLTEVDA